MNIGKNIILLLGVRDMTQKELAEKVGVTQATMSRWINGSRMPKLDMAVKVAEALEVDISALIMEWEW